ncbi:MAG TPA: pyridoxal phosphate-dependent aminotransferase, partial [Rhizobiaceae bacterium]|nr:pyridoxal phosphate-dependent aminotransferase [Rhizobiaceae bacterium]
WQQVTPQLREALARYHARKLGVAAHPDEFMVTGSGMQSIQMAIQATTGPGEECLYFSPAWPNFAAALAIAGGKPVAVELQQTQGGWIADIDALAASITPRTQAIFVNTPSNPTGWTASDAEIVAILDLARRHGLWIIADEIYALFAYGRDRAPSFADHAREDDRILQVNSFSKNWAMTGWRVGWIRTHPSLSPTMQNLGQYSTSGVAQFMQRGAVAALDHGDDFIAMQVERAQEARDILIGKLTATGRVTVAPPDGSFYLFFSIDGMTDTRQAAFDIVDDVAVGLAPGSAFGAGGQAHFRACFNRRLDQIEEAATRLADWIVRQPARRAA